MIEKMGVVVIGRNEGERLHLCLQSLISKDNRIVYVDSGSSDSSVAYAHSLGINVVELDTNIPLCAARARNEGFNMLLKICPDTEWVFFVDGDCEVVDGWIEQAIDTISQHSEVAVVCGRRRERYPEKSVYNRICDLEWNTPIGDAHSCGGDSIMRTLAYQQVGGFNPSVVAGEEPELCHRLRGAGWKILRINADMTWHDVAITKLSQWWRREVRTGYGGLDVQSRFDLQDFARINSSARIWTAGWSLAIFVVWAISYFLSGNGFAIKAGIVVVMLLPLNMARIAWKGWGRGLSMWDAILYGMLIMLAKWSQFFGQISLILERRKQQQATLVEYKSAEKMDSYLSADLERYPIAPWLKEQSVWVIAIYRFGCVIDGWVPGLKKKVVTQLYWLFFRLGETITGISLPKEAIIGPGLRIYHFGNIFIHPHVQIGANCTLRQGTTIGNRIAEGPVPKIGNNVDIGAYAQILGDVTIGDGAKIGAMSVVLEDVPAEATAVGIPARVIP